jgi:uroporphyrinogen decarboxylase
MTGRERLLTAINNKKPDRLPCLIHAWIEYHLKTTMNGMDQFDAYKTIGMDPVIYVVPEYIYNKKDYVNWDEDYRCQEKDPQGEYKWQKVIKTPEGILTEKGAYNEHTSWITEHIIKNEKDFEIWKKYVPLPEKIDWSPVIEAKKKVGDNGIIRGYVFDFGQLSPWQTFSGFLYGTQESIIACYEKQDWMHYVLETLLEKKLSVLKKTDKLHWDLIESGGGGASNTVISPDLHKEFCVPYDRKQHDAIHQYGVKIVYHLCGGVMHVLDLVVANGTDGLETMTPPGMGGDCDLAEANRRVGDKLFFIGGFDQNAGFEKGNPKIIREMVQKLHCSRPQGGYICAPSDQFFLASIENLKAFADACRECVY